jgi:hypothetical protein
MKLINQSGGKGVYALAQARGLTLLITLALLAISVTFLGKALPPEAILTSPGILKRPQRFACLLVIPTKVQAILSNVLVCKHPLKPRH